MDGAEEKIVGRHEVGIENGDELALRGLESLGERARLEAVPIGAVMVGDRMADGGVTFYEIASYALRFRRWNRQAPGCRASRADIAACTRRREAGR